MHDRDEMGRAFDIISVIGGGNKRQPQRTAATIGSRARCVFWAGAAPQNRMFASAISECAWTERYVDFIPKCPYFRLIDYELIRSFTVVIFHNQGV